MRTFYLNRSDEGSLFMIKYIKNIFIYKIYIFIYNIFFMYIFIYFTHIFQRFLILHNECRLSLGELCSSLFLCIIKMPQRNRRVNVGNGVSVLVSIPLSYSQMRIGKLMSDFLWNIKLPRNWQLGKSWSQFSGIQLILKISHSISPRLRQHEDGSKLLPHPAIVQ